MTYLTSDYDLNFVTTTCGKPSSCYRTVSGLHFYHDGVIYDNSPSNLSKAFRRLTCCREGSLDLELSLQHNQRLFYEEPDVKFFFRGLSDSMSRNVVVDEDLLESIIKHAYLPHSKKKMRVQALANLVDKNFLLHPTFIDQVKAKFKTDEWAKHGKYGRSIVDLTVEGSLLGAYITGLLKHSLDGFRHLPQCQCEFVSSPDTTILSKVFTNLIQSDLDVYFPYFSDDSCIRLKCADGVFLANVDISSCDTSHTPYIFKILADISSFNPQLSRFIDGLIAQCNLPIVITNIYNKKEKVRLTPTAPCLYTGSTLTTLINNIANLCIYYSIVRSFNPNMRVSDASKFVTDCATRCGYLVTVDACDTYHSLQFLKHSPVFNGSFVPILNLGVILRVFGICRGDFPGKGVLSVAKVSKYNCSLTACFKYAGNYKFLNLLRFLFPPSSKPSKLDGILLLITGHHVHDVPDFEVYRRYTDNEQEYIELCDIVKSNSNCLIRTSLTDKIMRKDYSFTNDKF